MMAKTEVEKNAQISQSLFKRQMLHHVQQCSLNNYTYLSNYIESSQVQIRPLYISRFRFNDILMTNLL